MPKPSIGRIVHFVLGNGQHRPAIITRVWEDDSPGSYPPEDEVVNMTIFPDGSNDVPAGSSFTLTAWGTSVHHDESCKPRTWHWPEPVE